MHVGKENGALVFGFREGKRRFATVFYVQQYCTVHFINEILSAIVQHYLNMIPLSHKRATDEHLCQKESQNLLLYMAIHGVSPSGISTSGRSTVSSTSLACLKQGTFPSSKLDYPNPFGTILAQNYAMTSPLLPKHSHPN